MATYSIGSFTFDWLSPKPPSPSLQITTESRTRVAGMAAWQDAIRGKSHTVETEVGVANQLAAQLLIEDYEAINQTTPVLPVIYADRLLPYKVLVLDVEPIETNQILLGVNGTGTFRGICKARWRLVSWPNS